MAEKTKIIDFSQLIARLNGALIDDADLPAVWGGEFPAKKIGEFLKAWSLPDRKDMPWCLWEQIDRIVLENKTLPTALDLLEYGRIFGEGGDLSISRDEDKFLWHFVGKSGTAKPEGFKSANNFWSQQKDLRFRQWEESALLWGKKHDKDKDQWFDDRVARAKLVYPGLQSSRVEIYYRIYTNSGQIKLVWLLGLRRYQEIS